MKSLTRNLSLFVIAATLFGGKVVMAQVIIDTDPEEVGRDIGDDAIDAWATVRALELPVIPDPGLTPDQIRQFMHREPWLEPTTPQQQYENKQHHDQQEEWDHELHKFMDPDSEPDDHGVDYPELNEPNFTPAYPDPRVYDFNNLESRLDIEVTQPNNGGDYTPDTDDTDPGDVDNDGGDAESGADIDSDGGDPGSGADVDNDSGGSDGGADVDSGGDAGDSDHDSDAGGDPDSDPDPDD